MELFVPNDAHGLSTSFSSSGIGDGSLSADRQTALMAQSTVRTNTLESFKVRCDLSPKITLHQILPLKNNIRYFT